jgi:hypothetical protein
LGATDSSGMAPVFMLLFGVCVGLIGAATALDVVSLRSVAHSLDVPVLSGLVIALRESMPTSTAHALEPAIALAGGTVAVWSVMRRARVRGPVAARLRRHAVRTVLALGVLRTG